MSLLAFARVAKDLQSYSNCNAMVYTWSLSQEKTMARIIATHSGPFHADDVFAVALLDLFYPHPIEVVRTRDRDTIEAADIVVDVGYVYDPAEMRFDHHQPTYEGQKSSVGMVLGWLEEAGHIIPFLANFLRQNLVDELDDADTNGTASAMSLFIWNMNTVKAMPSEADHREAFDTALSNAKAILRATLKAGVAAMEQQEALEKIVSEQAHEDIVVFPHYMKDLVFRVAQAHLTAKFVVWQAGDDAWMVQCVPPVEDRQAQRLPFPKEIRGLRGSDLEQAVDVDLGVAQKPESVFIHTGGFVGGAATKAGALALADFALHPQLPKTVVL
jgi:uncharacterized UPF0160 family protein